MEPESWSQVLLRLRSIVLHLLPASNLPSLPCRGAMNFSINLSKWTWTSNLEFLTKPTRKLLIQKAMLQNFYVNHMQGWLAMMTQW
jgi:hypothetical protein